jgi:hypothetical protein
MSSYDWTGWESEEEATDGPARPDTHFITIREDGEEIAVIVHRTCDGEFPLDGEEAKSKEALAERIVAALRGASEPESVAGTNKPYTVIGYWRGDRPVSVGVIEGQHDVHAGEGVTEEGDWAMAIEADSPEAAETLAIAEMRANDDQDLDEDFGVHEEGDEL